MSELYKKYKKYVGAIYKTRGEEYDRATKKWERRERYFFITDLTKIRGAWTYRVEGINTDNKRQIFESASSFYTILKNPEDMVAQIVAEAPNVS